MRLFAQIGWYFRREWRRYLGAIALLVIIAVLQLIPPKVVGIVVDGVTQQHYTAEKVWMWIGALVLIMLSLGHIYMGTIGAHGAYKSMKTGYVDETWARTHHELWYKEIKAGKPEKSPGRPPAAREVAP